METLRQAKINSSLNHKSTASTKSFPEFRKNATQNDVKKKDVKEGETSMNIAAYVNESIKDVPLNRSKTTGKNDCLDGNCDEESSEDESTDDEDDDGNQIDNNTINQSDIISYDEDRQVERNEDVYTNEKADAVGDESCTVVDGELIGECVQNLNISTSKALADLLEALFGAIYLDSNRSFNAVNDVAKNISLLPNI